MKLGIFLCFSYYVSLYTFHSSAERLLVWSDVCQDAPWILRVFRKYRRTLRGNVSRSDTRGREWVAHFHFQKVLTQSEGTWKCYPEGTRAAYRKRKSCRRKLLQCRGWSRSLCHRAWMFLRTWNALFFRSSIWIMPFPLVWDIHVGMA